MLNIFKYCLIENICNIIVLGLKFIDNIDIEVERRKKYRYYICMQFFVYYYY